MDTNQANVGKPTDKQIFELFVAAGDRIENLANGGYRDALNDDGIDDQEKVDMTKSSNELVEAYNATRLYFLHHPDYKHIGEAGAWPEADMAGWR